MTPETLNKWRIIPRLAVVIFFYLLIKATFWFMGLTDPSNAQSLFISAVWGAAAAFFGFYMNTGGKSS